MTKLKIKNNDGTFSEIATKDYVSSQISESSTDTTYRLTKSGSTITLTGSDGSTTSVTDSNSTYSAGTKAPVVAGTATVGTSTAYAREDHIHPAQTTVSGNAGSATKLATARNLTVGKTAKSFNGTANVSWSLSEIGSNVYVGTAEPTDTDVNVWIDPSGAIDLSALWNSIYPIGSIYLTTNTANPKDLFPGTTWTQISDKFLVGMGSTYTTVGGTGGSATVSLASGNLPSHSHSVSITSGTQSANHTHTTNASSTSTSGGNHNHVVTNRTTTYASGVQSSWRCMSFDGTNSDYPQTVSTPNNDGSHSHSVSIPQLSMGTNSVNHTHSVSGNTGSTGSGTAFSIIPPYYAVYMWRRTA